MSNNNDIIFQVLDWDYYHYEESTDDEDVLKYKIRMYGITEDKKKIHVQIDDYTPFFYFKIPKNMKMMHVQILVNELTKKVSAKLKNSLQSFDIVERNIFWGFTNYEKYNFVRLIFHSYDGFRAYERALKYKIFNRVLGNKPIKYQMFESNIDPLLRFMHIRNIRSCGWVKIPAGKYNYFPKKTRQTVDDIDIYTNWQNVHNVDNNNISPMIVCSFDIECESEDGSFPQATRDGDRVIQIGATFNRYGEDDCFYRHMIALHECSPIDGITVEWYDDEKEVLLAFTKLIKKMNPDIITGYNIFGFDWSYLKARADKLGVHSEFCKLGRTVNEECKYIEKKLESSALGQNNMYYYKTSGRVCIDLLKVMQRDFKLNSYKLDSVVAEFIRDDVKGVEVNDKTSVIRTRSTYGLEVGRVIKFYFNDGLSDNVYRNEQKFKVLKIEQVNDPEGFKDRITIDGVLDGEVLENKKYKVIWCQAKDDVGAQDIFKLQKGSADDRATIAKYCIQDCVLCNKLMSKLHILTNNIGMANVCHVPLSFIFLRGQGVKIFSLVAKKCRQKKHLIPVIKKKNKEEEKKDDKPKPNAQKWMTLDTEEEEEEEDTGYEGATVFEPVTGVHFEPVSVLDYNSLYPSSMIMRNLSHECNVLDPKYDNLPGYLYHDIYYTKGDGTEKHCRFAQSINGSKGIVPEILQELLDARKKTRTMAEEEPDKFKAKILDGLQLAYKVTANSLYGQTGAPTSPIHMKDIAASTTATGREMLNASKIFIEVICRILVDSVLQQDYTSFCKDMMLLLKKDIDSLIGDDEIQILKDEDRYKYVNIFTKNPDPITDKKFINDKLGHKCINDYTKWLFEELYKLLKDYTIDPSIIYGDTDSVFIKWKLKKNGEIKLDQSNDALVVSMKLSQLMSALFAKVLPFPQNMAYEKTFYPFIILTKKRYVGNKYEFDPKKYYQNSMGIVLKRRDNAPIVKIVVGGIVKSILIEHSPLKAIEFTRTELKKILSGKYPIDKFIITKTLKGSCYRIDLKNYLLKKYPKDKVALEKIFKDIHAKEELLKTLTEKYVSLSDKEKITKMIEGDGYKDRSRIVHAVLADRMAERDPGNKPQSNDRIAYAYVQTEFVPLLQGDMVENPEYIISNNLQLDYLFYITNQIMKPALQFLEKIVKKPEKIFEDAIVRETNRKKGLKPITFYLDIANMAKHNNEKEDEDDEENEDEEYSQADNIAHVLSKIVVDFDKPIQNINIKNKNKNKKTNTKKKSVLPLNKPVASLTGGFVIDI